MVDMIEKTLDVEEKDAAFEALLMSPLYIMY
jgi:hypothetical protein